jgi:hypothetical protein
LSQYLLSIVGGAVYLGYELNRYWVKLEITYTAQ